MTNAGYGFGTIPDTSFDAAISSLPCSPSAIRYILKLPLTVRRLTMAKSFWKVWLRPNTLIKDRENDYIVEVSITGKRLNNEAIAQIIKDGGSELQFETRG
jgi:hypothetical protein